MIVRKKFFIPIGFDSLISIILWALPSVVLFYLASEHWWLYVAAGAWLLLFLLFGGHFQIRMIIISQQNIIASPSLTFFGLRQHYIKIPVEEIISADFDLVHIDGYTYRVRCLILTLRDMKKKTIILRGFSYLQYSKIKSSLLLVNPTITFKKDPSYIKENKRRNDF